ncbi:MAG TPA: hypothetical protein VGE52_10250 [Pirellulales bacterium]
MESGQIAPPTRPLALIAVALTGVFLGAALGAASNAVNGWVSPLYFVNILHWDDVQDVWRAAIAQGVFEGLATGLLFSLIFTAGAGYITGAACRYGFAIKHLLGIVAGAAGLWALGGLLAMGLAALSPEFYRRAIIGVPDDFREMLAYAWVGGSLVGLQIGGFAALVIGLVILRANWRRAVAAGGSNSSPIPAN